MPNLSYIMPPCHCATMRQAARQVTQLYDRLLAPTGLRVTQYSMLRMVRRHQPVTMQSFAARAIMDRTTLTRALRPLVRDGLVAVEPGSDARTRIVTITQAGQTLLNESASTWEAAQAEFEHRYGANETRDLRGMLGRVVEQMA